MCVHLHAYILMFIIIVLLSAEIIYYKKRIEVKQNLGWLLAIGFCVHVFFFLFFNIKVVWTLMEAENGSLLVISTLSSSLAINRKWKLVSK